MQVLHCTWHRKLLCMANRDPSWQTCNSFLMGTLPVWTQPAISCPSPHCNSTSWLLLGPTSSSCDFHGPPHPQKHRKMKRVPHLNFSLGQYLSLDRCFNVQVKDLQEHEKRCSKKDQQRQYPRPVISIGWVQVPSQRHSWKMSTHKHTERQKGGKERKSYLDEGHFHWLDSDPSRARSEKVDTCTQTQTERGQRESGSEEYFSVAWKQQLSMNLCWVSLLHFDIKALDSKQSWTWKVVI